MSLKPDNYPINIPLENIKEYRLLILCWSDGNSFVSINSLLLVSSMEANLLVDFAKTASLSFARKRGR